MTDKEKKSSESEGCEEENETDNVNGKYPRPKTSLDTNREEALDLMRKIASQIRKKDENPEEVDSDDEDQE